MEDDGESSKNLGEIFYNDKAARNENKEIEKHYQTDKLDLPKHRVVNPELFAKGREVLGNIVSRRMKTSGGTDIDWLIEHRNGFIILELKIFSDDQILITKAQMIAFENLYKKLDKCYFFIIGHDDIDFTKLEDKIWIFEMKDWINGNVTSLEGEVRDYSYGEKPQQGFLVERENMEEIDVKILRDNIDKAWNEFEN